MYPNQHSDILAKSGNFIKLKNLKHKIWSITDLPVSYAGTEIISHENNIFKKAIKYFLKDKTYRSGLEKELGGIFKREGT